MRHPVVVLVLLGSALLSGCAGSVPASSLSAGRLRPCADLPHCVSTDSSEPADRAMQAIPFGDPPAAAHHRMLAALAAEPRLRIVMDSGLYIRAAVASRVFRFVDDIELLADTATHRILFRSSSRLGHNDWGVNRARMERIQARLRM